MSLAARLAAPDPKIRSAAMRELVARSAQPDGSEIDALMTCLADDRKAVQRQAAEVIAGLLRRDDRLRQRLLRALGEPNERLRWGAAYALSAGGEARLDVLDVLVEVLGSADGDLRWAASDLIRRVAERHRAPVLSRLIPVAREGSGNQRKMALYCLRDLEAGGPELCEAAARALESADLGVRLAGLSALARLAEPSVAAARLTSLLDDHDPRLRRAAAGTLGMLGHRSQAVTAALRRVSESDDESLRRAAAAALRLLER